MTDLKSVTAPAIGQKGLERLFAMTRETAMKPDCTLFTAGYEQAKRDFRDALRVEVGMIDQEPEAEHIRVPQAELQARKASKSKAAWWWNR